MNEIKTIEEWKNELQTKNYIFEGMKEANNFATGKKLTKDEYILAIEKFLNGRTEVITMDRKEVKKTMIKKKNEEGKDD